MNYNLVTPDGGFAVFVLAANGAIFGVRHEPERDGAAGGLWVFEANQHQFAPGTFRFPFREADRAFLATAKEQGARLHDLLLPAGAKLVCSIGDGDMINLQLSWPDGTPWVSLAVARVYFRHTSPQSAKAVFDVWWRERAEPALKSPTAFLRDGHYCDVYVDRPPGPDPREEKEDDAWRTLLRERIAEQKAPYFFTIHRRQICFSR